MTIEEIKELLDLFNESGVGELEIERERRADSHPQGRSGRGIPGFAGCRRQRLSRRKPRFRVESAPAAGSRADSGQILVKSPIVGTYYDAPSPGSAPFVKVGDTVEPGQVLCIIESMKLMNEIEAETAGVIAAKLVENGRPVEYGEALFAIRPR